MSNEKAKMALLAAMKNPEDYPTKLWLSRDVAGLMQAYADKETERLREMLGICLQYISDEDWYTTVKEEFDKLLNQSETSSLKERFVSELDIIQSMLNQGRKNDAHTFINQKRKEYLSNDQPQKLKEGTGSENPTVQMHRDFQKRIGR